ncbi:Mn2+-dependent serine/threonine protein kinase [Psychromonas ingrahamii 37]|uniref:3-deoxy-D-manno-octulosonic acid kinase n=1 Tax=Psychromonas ingrahamii (strain DSM 17664 / CCUG 51855 / 37) TaxID=357804 RepID=A1SRT1_PSYIN|nr:3-deoxy-D-manno-octulosonic acid kinase [Psychromonas ingrahamii]ABM02196.1 Mn2+-dependent serine/threonine protein kinase [Psychromonas ingrahamii 37]
MKIIECNQQSFFFNAEKFSTLLFDLTFLQENNRVIGNSVGRGITWFFEHQQKKYVLRHYFRGGFIGKINPDNFFYAGLKRTRAYNEFILLDKMAQLNLPVPLPYAGRISRKGLFYQADLIIELIDGAHDLVAVLNKRKIGEAQWREIGRVIRLFHDNNIYHSDLNSHNIMLDKHNKVWLIDFDKCAQIKTGVWKEKTLARLLRSLRKEKSKKNHLNWSEQDWLSLIFGYQN